MKRFLCWIAVVVLLIGLVPTSLAAVGSGWNDDCRANQIIDKTGTISHGKHNWVKTDETSGNTCTSPGKAYYACSYCGARATRDTAAPGHRWSDWTVVQAATCISTGIRVRFCAVCRTQESQAIPKADHSYGSWVVLKEATCQSSGTQQRTCTICGHVETKTIPKTKDHNYGSWKVTREATCQQKGLRTRTCKTCGHKQEQSIKKTAHSFGEWVVTVEPTDHSAGERTHSCIWCGKTEKESFDPEGTLRRGDKGDEVKEMQHLLADFGYMKDSGAKGSFNAATEKAVAKFQKDHGLKSDGVAWPQTRARLAHNWSEWEIVVPTTPFSAGLRRRTCSDCGKTQEEEFDPEGTLRRGDEGDAVKELQIAMKGLGIFKYNTTGQFGKNTENSVKKYQKSKGLKSDGVAWPGVIDMILGKEPKEPDKAPEIPKPEPIPEPKPEPKVEPIHKGEIAFELSFVNLKAQKALAGEYVSAKVRVTNTCDLTIHLSAYGCSDAHPNDIAYGDDSFKGKLKPGESTVFGYNAFVTEEAFQQGYVERTMTARALDPETEDKLAVQKNLVIGLIKDDSSILLIPEDVSAVTISEGESYDVKYWCFNAGKSDLTNVQFGLLDADYDVPALDSLKNLPEPMPAIWTAGSGFEFEYHVEATSDDTKKEHIWRAVQVAAKDVSTGEPTGELAFFLMGLKNGKKVKPELPEIKEETDIKDPKISLIIHDQQSAYPVEGNKASFMLTVVNEGTMDVILMDITMLPEGTIQHAEWMDSVLEPGVGYETKCEAEVLFSDILEDIIERKVEVEVVDPENGRTASAVANVTMEFLEDKLIPPVTIFGPDDYVTVQKSISNMPAKGFFEKGDKILYELKLSNTRETTSAHNVRIDDDRIGLHYNCGTLLGGEDVTITWGYEVTLLDAMMPGITNTATVQWDDLNGEDHTVISNTVFAPTGIGTQDKMSLSLVKKVNDAPEHSYFYVQGEQIDFVITATNTGNVTIGYAEIMDILEKHNLGKIGEVSDLAPGKSVDFKFSYKVTGSDVEAGKVVNSASAVCMTSGFAPLTVVSNDVECPTGVFPGELHEGLNLIKGETSKPKNGKFYVEGETIHYAITLINHYRQLMGSIPMTVSKGSIYDLLEPAPGKIADVNFLKPGEFITVPYSYKVTAFDVGKGKVVNIATFEGDLNADEHVTIVSNEVVSPTGAYTGKPKGGSVCVRTLHEHSSSSEHATVDYCEQHAVVAETVQAVVNQASTEAELLSAWQTAIDIWNEALNLEYQDRLAHASKDLAEAIQSEWVQFHLQVTNCRNAMIRKAGGENSSIAKLIAEMLMNHCADLCGESSLTAAQRRDSVLDAKTAMNFGFAPAQCMEQTHAVEDGVDISTMLCETHQKTQKIIDKMLTGLTKADKDTLRLVWKRAEDLWTVELDREANARFSTANDGGQLYIVERLTFGEWLTARKAMLAAEYPNNPEIVQELIARAIMERVIALCAQN